MRSKLAIAACAGLLTVYAQELRLDPRSSVRINLPDDSPVTLVSADLGQSRAIQRGSAVVLDLQMVLSLRNSSPSHIRGVTLLVTAQEATPGGKASVSVPSLDVPPGSNFPVRIDLQLMRPAQMASGPVAVTLDGVLFQDLSFYGPNRLDCRRAMTAWEMEAQRDRRHFKAVLASAGREGLRRAIFDSMLRQEERPRLNVRVVRGGRAVSSAAFGPEHTAQFAFLEFPDSPVKPVDGWAQISGSEARAPRIQVRNRSSRPVRYVEIGWIVRDRQGREFMAASVPASDPGLYLPPGATGRVLQDSALRFSRDNGQALDISGMTGFVSQVEYADGEVWVPGREALSNAQLLRILAPSPEEQRLTDLYRKKGLDALVSELNKF